MPDSFESLWAECSGPSDRDDGERGREPFHEDSSRLHSITSAPSPTKFYISRAKTSEQPIDSRCLQG